MKFKNPDFDKTRKLRVKELAEPQARNVAESQARNVAEPQARSAVISMASYRIDR